MASSRLKVAVVAPIPRPRVAMMTAEMRRFKERPPELQPTIDRLEVFLVRLFLRRYVTYCARRRRFGAMNGAARLYAELISASA